MSIRKNALANMPRDSVMDWLLQKSQPAVCYFTLIELLDRPREDLEVQAAYQAISERGWGAEILGEQNPAGFWASRENLYYPKYVASNWHLLVLADLGLTKQHPRIRKACELFLGEYAKPDGGFGRRERSHFCVTGNSARTLVRCGYEDDPRVRSAFKWLIEAQKADGGWHCFDSRRGTLDCWEALSAFSALPKRRWTRLVKRSVERGAEFYLERDLFREGKRRYEPWFRFHYPVHYYYDLLVGLDVITALGYGDDSRLKPALKVLREKRRPDGAWLLDAIHPDLGPGAKYVLGEPVTPFALEKAGEPSKWITLQALRVLKRVEGEAPIR
ncbi:MAG: hypothetical protein HY619_06720 [Thaumarchaeota archaeon]|nr:hypothetical protein [Nitrososphaerota archaeon]